MKNKIEKFITGPGFEKLNNKLQAFGLIFGIVFFISIIIRLIFKF